MTLDAVNPAELAKPSGFAHAVRARNTTTVHLAGQTALNDQGRIVGETVVAQFEQAIGNLLTALDAAGGSHERLASLTMYIVDIDDYKAHAKEIGRVWKKTIGRHYPAVAAVGVSRLWDIEALIEVQGIAEL